MNILGLAASPRKGGNTDILLKSFLEGAAQDGIETEIIHLVDLDISPCMGCETCFEDGQCMIEDDASRVYDKLLLSDMLVLATPVYFYSVSSHAKLLIDRCQCLWARRYKLELRTGSDNGVGVMLSTGGSGGPKMFEGIKLTAKYFFDSLGKKMAGSLTYSNIDRKGSILEHPNALEEAASLGRELIGHL